MFDVSHLASDTLGGGGSGVAAVVVVELNTKPSSGRVQLWSIAFAVSTVWAHFLFCTFNLCHNVNLKLMTAVIWFVSLAQTSKLFWHSIFLSISAVRISWNLRWQSDDWNDFDFIFPLESKKIRFGWLFVSCRIKSILKNKNDNIEWGSGGKLAVVGSEWCYVTKTLWWMDLCDDCCVTDGSWWVTITFSLSWYICLPCIPLPLTLAMLIRHFHWLDCEFHLTKPIVWHHSKRPSMNEHYRRSLPSAQQKASLVGWLHRTVLKVP